MDGKGQVAQVQSWVQTESSVDQFYHQGLAEGVKQSTGVLSSDKEQAAQI